MPLKRLAGMWTETMRRKLPFLAGTALILAASLGGCAGSGLSLPALPKPEEIATDETKPPDTGLQAMLIPSGRVVGTPTEVYTRLARGVLTCWFGAEGPLKAAYIYHAQADPASKGGRAQIRIMTRDHEASDPRALRAYLIAISPGEGVTKVEVENRRLPEHLALALKEDVDRWARGEDGCGEGPVTAGWTADPAQEPAKAQTGSKKSKAP